MVQTPRTNLSIRAIFLMLWLIILCGCSLPQNNPTLTPTHVQTPTLTPTLTLTPVPTLTPTTIPRWQQYEDALARASIQQGQGNAACEWSILGTAPGEVYVWALCKSKNRFGTTAGFPAVIYLGENGKIERVAIPGDGSDYAPDIQALFPPEIQARIFAGDRGRSLDMDYLESRLTQDAPPQIVVQGTPLP